MLPSGALRRQARHLDVALPQPDASLSRRWHPDARPHIAATGTPRIAEHSATAWTGLVPAGVPSSRPRIVAMIRVTGWCTATPWSQTGIVAIGTQALLG
jgi:hypothetical protein